MPDTRLGDLPEDVRVYLRPTGFIDAPFGHDGKALRLAGGLLWFSAIELIAAQGDKRILSELVPVERLEAALAELAAGPRASAESTLARLTAERPALRLGERTLRFDQPHVMGIRSEEHTSELQSLMRISYVVFCLKKNTDRKEN